MQATCENAYDRVIHPFLKLAVSPAEYLATSELAALLGQAGFTVTEIQPVACPFFIPSVYLVAASRT